jgi:hypothetical protein
MNTRTLLIIAALAVPPIALAIIIQSGPVGQKNNLLLSTGASSPNTAITNKGAISSEPVHLPVLDVSEQKRQHAQQELTQMRERIAQRLAALQRMTPAQWPAERARHPHVPSTLDEAIARNTAMLSQLQAITPEEWVEGKRPRAVENYTPSSGH